MTRYLDEQDRYLTFLTAAHHDARNHEHALAEDLNHVHHDLYGSHELPNQSTHNQAAVATMREMDCMKKIWGGADAESESLEIRK